MKSTMRTTYPVKKPKTTGVIKGSGKKITITGGVKGDSKTGYCGAVK